MLYEGVQLGSKNGHGANELAYRKTLYVAKDEMDGGRQLAMESLKELAGGGIKKTSRPFGAAEPITWVWKALPFLYCNWGCLPQLDSTDPVGTGRIRILLFETLFEVSTGATGVPKGFSGRVKPGKHNVQDVMHAHRGPNMWLLLLAAHRLAKQHGGALSEAEWPAEWTQAKRDAMDEADPMCRVVRKVVRENVQRGWVLAKGEEYEDEQGQIVKAATDRVDFVKRSRLMRLVQEEAGQGRSLEMRGQAKAVKRMLDAEMEAHGYAYQERDTSLHGVRVKDCYLGCREMHELDGL
jgi:hypothetical protein